MVGGTGDDVYAVDAGSDLIVEAAGEGSDRVTATADYTLSAHVENLTLTGSALNGTGNAQNNTLTGTDAANRLVGLGGDDSLVGGLGNDTLEGGDGNDTLNGGAGDDVMTGGAGDDTFLVDSALDLTNESTGGGIDWVISSVNRSLNTNTENLRLTGSANSGTGSSLANRMEAAGVSTNLFGGGGDDTLVGGAGSDTLNGSTGNDSMLGGAGSDTYVVDSVLDLVEEAPGQGTDRVTVNASIDWTLGPNFERLNFAGSFSGSGTGNELANFLQGGNGANALFGLEGNDTLTGGGGNDTLDGGTGNDTMLGETGNDIYYVDASGDITQESSALASDIDLVISSVNRTLNTNIENLTLTGSAISGAGNNSNNLITGNAEHNSLLGVAGNDTLDGGTGNDTLNGGTGNDSMLGGLGDDVYAVDATSDVVVELAGQGTDRVSSTVNWTLGDNVENLTLSGSAGISGTGNALDNVIGGNPGANAIDGGAGNDTISGGDGNDTLTGGSGADRLSGGLGADGFRFVTTGEGADTITDFASGTDKILVVAANFGLVAGGAANLFVNSAPNSAAAAFIYTSSTGVFQFDADGNGAGAAVQLASLFNRPPSLAPADIVLGS
jgi:Ca2+-binding RTX toxin-like protein